MEARTSAEGTTQTLSSLPDSCSVCCHELTLQVQQNNAAPYAFGSHFHPQETPLEEGGLHHGQHWATRAVHHLLGSQKEGSNS